MGRADLHLHTTFSDGLDFPRTMVQEASRRGLDVIAITDHDTIEGALRARDYSLLRPDLGVEVVVGSEISTLNGHVIGLFLKEFIPPRLTARRTVEWIHAQGGLAVLAHPTHAYTGRFRGFPRAAEILREIPFDAIETINEDNVLARFSQSAAERLASSHDLACVGVSDAHNRLFLGKGFTEFKGKGAEDLRKAVLVRETRALKGDPWNAQEILRHLRDSTSVVFRYARIRTAA